MAWAVAKVEKLRPPERGGHAMAWVGSSVVVVGGTSRHPVTLNDVWRLNPVQDSIAWSKMDCRPPEESTSNGSHSPSADSVATRVHATATVIGSRLFLIGGYSPDTGTVYNDVAILDVDSSSWSWPPVNGEMPEPFHSHSATLLPRGRILIFGGKIGHEIHTNAIYILDTVAMVWHKVKAIGTPPSPREMHTTVAVRPARLLVYGGRDATEVLSDAIFFNADDMHWEEKRRTTEYKSVGHSAVVTPDGATLVYGGFSGTDIEGHLLRITKSLEVEVLSDASSAAKARRLHGAASPPPRIAHSAVLIPRFPPQLATSQSHHLNREGDASSSQKSAENSQQCLLPESSESESTEGHVQKAQSKNVASDERQGSPARDTEAADILLSLSLSRAPEPPRQEPQRKEDVSAELIDLASVLSSLSISGKERSTSGSGGGSHSGSEHASGGGESSSSSGWQMLVFGGATTDEDLNDVAIWDPQAQGCSPMDDDDAPVDLHFQEI